MKKLFLISVVFLIASNMYGQRNFYTIIDSLYENDTNLSLPDSLKKGREKNIDRMNEIWSQRLAPHGEISIAAQKIISYSQSFEEQRLNKSGGINANWVPEGPIGTVFGSMFDGHGQINRLAFDPKYNTIQNGSLNKTIYAGSFFGGLWRSEDAGQNWSVVNTDDQLPQTSVSGIAISNQNSDYIFICTGHGDGVKQYKSDYFGDAEMPIFTNGVYRTLDYGQNWEPINNGLLSHFTNGGTARNIIVNSTNANILYIATSEGVYKTANALGSTPTWSKLTVSSNASVDFRGLEQHPTNSSTIYAASNDIFMSTNSGSNWSSMTGLGTGLDFTALPGNFTVERINLAVTPAAPDRLYAYINGRDTKKNPGGHKSAYIFMFKNGIWEQLHYGNYYNNFPQIYDLTPSYMGFAVSPIDPEIVFYSFTVVYGSEDITSQTFSLQSGYHQTPGYHPDSHVLEFEPNTSSNPKLFSGNHGGVSVKDLSSSSGFGWSYRNNGLNVGLIWSFDVSKVDKDVKVIGMQDNGAHKFVNGNWAFLSDGDGYGAQIYNDNLGHRFTYGIGSGENATNMDLPYDAIEVAHGPNRTRREWAAHQYQIHEHPVSNKPVFGFSELYTFPGLDRPVSVSSSTDWTVESDLYREESYVDNNGSYIFHWPGSKRIREFAIAKSNPDYIYLATFGYPYPTKETIFFRSNSGLKNGVYDDYNNPSSFPPRKFLNINEDPLSNLKSFISYNGQNYAPFVTGIAVNPSNENEVWISVSGFNTNLRVLKSSNGGVTWSNADPTNSLPEMPANNIVYQDGSNNRLYLATDVGVYVKDDAMFTWEKYGDIPNVRVNELYIRYCDNKLYAGTYGRGIWSVDLMEDNESLSFLEIDSDITWDNDRFADYNIKVKSGNTLTLEAKLYMPMEGRIIVEKGAQLVVDGGEITNSCDNFWEGIEVRGDNGFDQSNMANQGVLILKNGAVIENAREITVLDNTTWGAGGIIKATDATFRNCIRAVSFYSYPYNNTSFFKRCKFELTANYIPNGAKPQVTLWDNKGVRFLGCEFVDNTGINEFDEYDGSGIYSIDASYFVGADCGGPNPNTLPCATQYVTRSSFKNFNYGIRALGSATTNAITIDETDFENNSIAMQVEALDQVRFSRNIIKTGGLLKNNYQNLNYNYLYGSRFIESSGYEVEENIFMENGMTMSTNGLNIVNSGQVANEVYRNDFRDLTVGEKYDGINKHVNDAFVGLQFLCNSNSIRNDYDVQVNTINTSQFTPGEGIRSFQGAVNPDLSAGNSFSANPVNAEGHIQNKSPHAITYQYSSSGDQPTNYTPSFVIPNLVSNPNNCPSNYWTMIEPGFFEMPEGAVSVYYTDLHQYKELLYNYHRNIDNGNTDSLIEAIGLYFPNEAQELRDDLMSEAPYLSQPVLMDAAMTGILTDALLLEVCLANPDATRDEAFLDFVEFEIPNPLPSNMVQLIYQNWDAETPRTLIEGELANQNAKVGRLFNQILHYYKTDTLSHVDSVLSMYQSISTLQSKFRLVEVALSKGDFEATETLLQDIQFEHELSTLQQNEFDNLVSYVSFKQSITANDKNILQLDESDLNTLRNIAELNTGRTSVMAQNILCFGYQECASSYTGTMERKVRNRIYSETPMNNETESIKIHISPNPADNQINLSFEGVSDEEKVIFEIHTIEGKLVLEKQLNNQSSLINISNLDDGAYLYSIYVNNKKIKTDKLIIQH